LGISLTENLVEIPPYASLGIEFIGKLPDQSPEETNFPIQWQITPVDHPNQTKTVKGKLICRKDPVPDFSLTLTNPLPKSVLSGEKLSIPLTIIREKVMITLWINRNQISLTNLSTNLVINKMIEAAPEIKSSRTFIPLRLVSEEFGAKVTWDSKTFSIEILY
jgi:hypothetical protein